MKYEVSCLGYNSLDGFHPNASKIFKLGEKGKVIEYFLKSYKKSPTCVAVLSYSKSDAIDLLKYFVADRYKYTDVMQSLGYTPNIISYFFDSSINKINDECSGFLGNEDFPDQVHPFSFG